MFKKKGGSHAVNTDGFEVKFYGRDELIYVEHLLGGGHRQVTIYAGLLVGRVNRSIEAGSRWLNHWNPPNHQVAITENERKQIVKNITDALDFLGISYELSQ